MIGCSLLSRCPRPCLLRTPATRDTRAAVAPPAAPPGVAIPGTFRRCRACRGTLPRLPPTRQPLLAAAPAPSADPAGVAAPTAAAREQAICCSLCRSRSEHHSHNHRQQSERRQRTRSQRSQDGPRALSPPVRHARQRTPLPVWTPCHRDELRLGERCPGRGRTAGPQSAMHDAVCRYVAVPAAAAPPPPHTHAHALACSGRFYSRK